MRYAFVAVAVLAIAIPASAWEKAPNFSKDAVWIDADASVPHTISGYRGHVLLIDFWEYTCINCIRDFAVLKRWYAKYHSYGFDIVGVHYGEFAIGFKPANVRAAAKEYRLPWPIVADVKGSIWKAYDSEAWPNRYLIDPKGNIAMHIEGEGNNRAMEEKIRKLLSPDHPEIRKIALDPDENTFSPQCGISTPETYVGDWFGRGAVENREGYHDGAIKNFRPTRQPHDGGVILAGEWRAEHDGMTSAGKDAQAELRYHARSLYAVLSLENPQTPVKVYLRQDARPITQDSAGRDVRFDAQGAYIVVSEARMYYLVKNPEFGSHLLTLEPQASGFTLHSFTYGNNCQQEF